MHFLYREYSRHQTVCYLQSLQTSALTLAVLRRLRAVTPTPFTDGQLEGAFVEIAGVLCGGHRNKGSRTRYALRNMLRWRLITRDGPAVQGGQGEPERWRQAGCPFRQDPVDIRHGPRKPSGSPPGKDLLWVARASGPTPQEYG